MKYKEEMNFKNICPYEADKVAGSARIITLSVIWPCVLYE